MATTRPVDLLRVVDDRWFAETSLSPSTPFAVVITSCTLVNLLLMQRGLYLDTENSLGTLLLDPYLDVLAWFWSGLAPLRHSKCMQRYARIEVGNLSCCHTRQKLQGRVPKQNY